MLDFRKTFALGAVLVAAATYASATPITGTLSISSGAFGSANYSSGTINFAGPGVVGPGGTGTMAPIVAGTSVSLIPSFNYTGAIPAAGDQIFSTTAGGVTVDYLLKSVTSSFDPNGFLDLSGMGFLQETGFSDTAATFFLSTQGPTGMSVSFSATSTASTAVTPEPSSLILLGTGLVSSAGMLLRRRRVA